MRHLVHRCNQPRTCWYGHSDALRPAHRAAFCYTRPNPASRTPTQRLSGICYASKSYYEILGVAQSASAKEIKAAYRKVALKLHPDVNKAPDAKERFIDAKRAFETLADDGARQKYDLKMRMGSATAGFDYSAPFGSGGYRRPSTVEEDSYTFDDLVRDLEKEWNQSAAAGKGMGDVLNFLGEEFLDFMEESLGIKEEAKGSNSGGGSSGASAGSSSSSSSSSGGTSSSSTRGGSRGSAAYDEFSRYYDSGAYGSTSSSSQTSQQSSSGQQKKGSDDDIEETLKALKQKLNKT